MKKNSYNKGLLIPWLLKALNENLYSGLKWSDRKKRIFYILWTHKSAEQWTKTDLEPFEAWAEHKGKLHGKNEKQLKATFRCALNSKRELVEVGRTRSKRFWQFVDPEPNNKENSTKKKRKAISSQVENIPYSSDSGNNTSYDDIPSLLITSSGKIIESSKLPKFESICSSASLTPPHPDSEMFFSFNSLDSDSHQQKANNKENYRLMGYTSDDVTSNISSNRISIAFTNSISSIESSSEAESSLHDKLPPFHTFSSFFSLTPPPQKDDIFFNFSEYGSRSTPSPDNHSQLKSPSEVLYSDNRYQEARTDLWHPNGWTTSLGQQDLGTFNHFFSDDFEGTHKSLKPKPEVENNSQQMEFVEMDHLVPVLDVTLDSQVISRTGQYDCTNKALIGNNHYEQVKLDDDYLLSDDVDPEACEKIMQELSKLRQHESEVYNYFIS